MTRPVMDQRDEVNEPPLDHMDQNFGKADDAIIFFGVWIGAAILALFSAAMWALARKRVIWTTMAAGLASIGWIVVFSSANGM